MDKKSKRNYYKLTIIYACLFGIFIDSLRTISTAATSNYTIILYYNHYGEGIYELIMFYILLLIGIYGYYVIYSQSKRMSDCITANDLLKKENIALKRRLPHTD